MRKFTAFLTSIAALITFSVTGFAEDEKTAPRPLVTDTEYGSIVFCDTANILTDVEENYIFDTISDAIAKKNISIGVVTSVVLNQEIADAYYGQISDTDSDFALLLYNSEEHGFYFYGSAKEEFAHDEDAFWITENYLEGAAYFAAGLQFPLDIQYHTVSEINTEETTQTEIKEAESEILPDDSFTELADNGIHTVTLENGHTALLHDLDDSLSSEAEAEVLSDLMEAVRDKDFSIGIVITDDIGSDKSDYGVMDFADVYYEEYCGKNTDGLLLLINNDTKYDWISTSGGCIDMFYDAVDPIFDAMYNYLVDGNYNYACQRFVQEVKYYSEQEYVYYDDYDYYFDSEEIEGFFSLIVFGLFVSVISVAIFTGSINSGYRMKKNVTAANYKLANSLVFNQQTDTYLRTYTTRRTVSSSSSGGSRSRSGGRSHRSSRGGRHGGGGRRR